MMKNSRRSNALRRYLRLLEAYCPDTLHVWMPRFDGRRTSSATYDLVSGTALNLGSGATFSGDGKYIVLDTDEIASTDLTSRPYVYLALVLKKDYSVSGAWPFINQAYEKNMQVYYSNKEFFGIGSTDGTHDDAAQPKVGFNSVSGLGFVTLEIVSNATEAIARSAQEDYHADVAGAILYSMSGASMWLRGWSSSDKFAALVYGGATTSAPLESLASVVKRGESGSLLTEMFRELI